MGFVCFFFFFFQAEDGIRDTSVTGVQTCALPISPDDAAKGVKQTIIDVDAGVTTALDDIIKTWYGVGSEERRVGKESRSREWKDTEEKKNKGKAEMRKKTK